MKNILLVLREPFLDRIPSLKSLLWFLANKGYKITIITSESKNFTLMSFNHDKIRVLKVKQRRHMLELPTSVKIVLRSILYIAFNRIDFIIGGDMIGNIISTKIASLFNCKHVFFMLEYPQIPTNKHPQLNRLQKYENVVICKADCIITHDKWHKQFLVDNYKLPHDKIFLLPNASFTPEFTFKSNFLQERLKLSNKIIVLHSGGFGRWFKCKELADSAINWSDHVKLIFHMSHRLDGDLYFENIYTHHSDNVCFSLDPVLTHELDMLVASADIGIALYSVDELEYRATLIGLAAGKIGNYLKCGVPVIATRLQSLSYIEEYGCGILVDDEKDIINAIECIMSNRALYSQNAYQCYRILWHPEKYLNSILTFFS